MEVQLSAGENIMNLRKRLKLTQRQVAAAVGVTDQTVSNWENEIYTPTLTPAQTLALCKVLQCSLEELVAAITNGQANSAT